MSRTDNHRPFRVQVVDPQERHRWHRINDAHHTTLWPLYRFGCRPGGCSCGKWEWAQERRRQRHQAQRLTREALKGGAWE
jgi:hypothetical protein